MTQKTQSRRSLLQSGLRGLAAGAIVALAAGLSLKRLLRNDSTLADNQCSNDGLCSACGRLGSCILPAGVSTRRAIGK